ncbi:MAG: holo-ACP synthase [bacterium]
MSRPARLAGKGDPGERTGTIMLQNPSGCADPGPSGLSAGVDLVSVERIETMLARWGEKFLRRVYTDGEIAYCMARANPARSLAARFAAKEAFYKAVSAWREGPIAHKSIEVVVCDNGVPAVRPHGRAEAALGRRAATLSLSHENHYAIAVVVTCAPRNAENAESGSEVTS